MFIFYFNNKINNINYILKKLFFKFQSLYLNYILDITKLKIYKYLIFEKNYYI